MYVDSYMYIYLYIFIYAYMYVFVWMYACDRWPLPERPRPAFHPTHLTPAHSTPSSPHPPRILFGTLGACLGGAHPVRGAARVVLGGWLALAVVYGIGRLIGEGA